MSTSISQFEKFSSSQELEAYLLEDAKSKYADLFGQTFNWYPYPYYVRTAEALQTDVAAVNSVSGDYSKTNTQEQGVDEGDLIKTDGEYVYLVDDFNTITIVDVGNPSLPAITAQVDLKGSLIQEIYLHSDDRMTIISTGWNSSPSYSSKIAYPYYYSEPTVNVTVLDISDPTRAQVLETTEIEGSLTETRSINDKVYVVTQSSFGLPAPEGKYEEIDPGKEPPIDPIIDLPVRKKPILEIDPIIDLPVIEEPLSVDDVASSEPTIVLESEIVDTGLWYPYPPSQYTYETEEEYIARISNQILSLSLPEYSVIDSTGQEIEGGFLTQPTNIYKPITDQPYQLTTVSVFDPTDSDIGPSFSTSLPDDWISTVYASPSNLYLATSQWDWQTETQTTEILKFALNADGTVELVAQGEVPGYLLNQFSLDEHNGYLRIATTTFNNFQNENNIYVLEQLGQTLNIKSEITGLAPGERIYSARFEGDLGYLVTFRQVDPLFVINFSDPANPQVESELKIPGFSEYLQIIELDGERHLIGIGRDADPVTGLTGTLKLSLFDVEDITQPTEVDNYLFPEEGYVWSQAAWEHHAVGYYPEWEVLAIPFQSSDWVSGEFSQGLRVFQLDSENGITALGDIIHTSAIERSLRIGSYLVSLSDTQLTLHQYSSQGLTLAGEVGLLDQEDYWILWDTFSGVSQDSEENLNISVKTASTKEQTDPLNGTSNKSLIIGTEEDDKLAGTKKDDTIIGARGDDTVHAGSGDDNISGGQGNDRLFGGNDNDIVTGGRGDDRLHGGNGNDSLSGGQGNDTLRGEAGRDTLVGGGGDDVLIGASASRDYPYDSFDSDTLTGGQGSDRFILGDAQALYYDESNIVFIQPPSDPGEPPLSYALITDFNANEKDVIQLKGGLNYSLEQVSLKGGISGIGIYLSEGSFELIGVIQNVANVADLSLTEGKYLSYIRGA